ncbi:cytochrome P450 [Nocardia otitidiscaviarum]|uniref:Cytochrome P450 n=3 Tax=Nocardia otitidiscaviarum TaxID=1823 RepID=A0A516NXB6_9NOCA|nr:cytochrome P450 [Nocardia otitidiscaviarum]
MTALDENQAAVHNFPMRRQCPFAPAAEYAELREQGSLARVLLPSGQQAWVVTRYDEVQRVLAHPQISTDITRPGFPELTSAPDAERYQLFEGEFFNMDSPEHDIYRRMLIPEFSFKRIKALRARIQAMIDELLDTMLAAGPPADLAEAFALPVASLGICQLLGIPYEDHRFFQSRVRTRKIEASEDMLAPVAELRGYTDDVITRAEREPGDNLIGRLVTQRVLTGEITHNAAVGMVLQLLIAAHETTSNMIMLGTLTLLRHPDQLTELRADPALWPGAVDELLRYHSVADGPTFARIALGDIEIGDQVIRAGDAVFALCASANHDERAFARAGEFDIHRSAGNHLAFGYGVHQCIGQNLARAWLESSYETLFRRVPTLRLNAEVEDLSFKYDAAIFGLDEFPVTW